MSLPLLPVELDDDIVSLMVSNKPIPPFFIRLHPPWFGVLLLLRLVSNSWNVAVMENPAVRDIFAMRKISTLQETSMAATLLKRYRKNKDPWLWKANGLEPVARCEGDSVVQFNAVYLSCDEFVKLEQSGLRILFQKLYGWDHLTMLDLRRSKALQDAELLRRLQTLTVVILMSCPELQNVDALNDLPRLQQVIVSNCPKIRTVDQLSASLTLFAITVMDCNDFRSPIKLNPPNLGIADFCDCPMVVDVSGLLEARKLRILLLKGSGVLKTPGGLESLVKLLRKLPVTTDIPPHQQIQNPL